MIESDNNTNNIYPLIIMEYYPLRLNIKDNKNYIVMCRNIQEVERLLILYHKEIGEIIKNIQIIQEKEIITFEVADIYFDEKYSPEDNDWYTKTINYETLKVFKDENK